MAVSTPFARSYFRAAWSDAQGAGIPLLQKLETLNSAAVASTSSGRSITVSQGNGRRVEFQVPGGSTKAPAEGVSPTDIAELCSRLLDIYDASVTAGNSNDQTHATWILGKLEAVRKTRSDYRLLRSSKLDLFPIYPFYR